MNEIMNLHLNNMQTKFLEVIVFQTQCGHMHFGSSKAGSLLLLLKNKVEMNNYTLYVPLERTKKF